MNKEEALKIYEEHRLKENAYTLLFSTVYYDKSTIAPKKGNAYRNKMFSFLMGEMHDLEIEPDYIEAVKILKECDLGEVKNRDIKFAYDAIEKEACFTKEETAVFNLDCFESEEAWEEAKHKADYSIFEKHLVKMFETMKKRAHKRKPEADPYDVLLNDFEEGMNKEKYDEFFSLLKKEIIPLIKKVSDKQSFINDSFLYQYYPKKKQEIFMKKYLIPAIGFDEDWCYMGVSEHPFTNGISQNDVRITTSYDEHNITSCIFSIIHEVGHSYYEHQVDEQYEGTHITKDISSGMHESQSRFLENYIGRRKSFWIHLYPHLQEIFPENLGNVSLDEFVLAINASKPSLIRTDADELTYPVHILIRYELEKGIFEGTISKENLNLKWNQMYKDYLGLDVMDDAKGILQDIHWSDGSFGYFPTYALGSAVGAQIFEKMLKDVQVDEELKKGNFKAIVEWLKVNLQKYGALYDLNTLVKMCTGEDFNPSHYVKYLKEKYKKLYQIEE